VLVVSTLEFENCFFCVCLAYFEERGHAKVPFKAGNLSSVARLTLIAWSCNRFFLVGFQNETRSLRGPVTPIRLMALQPWGRVEHEKKCIQAESAPGWETEFVFLLGKVFGHCIQWSSISFLSYC
jgi:hypothetical protein